MSIKQEGDTRLDRLQQFKEWLAEHDLKVAKRVEQEGEIVMNNTLIVVLDPEQPHFMHFGQLVDIPGWAEENCYVVQYTDGSREALDGEYKRGGVAYSDLGIIAKQCLSMSDREYLASLDPRVVRLIKTK